MKDITLPLALPAIFSGFTLALLEAITVFGAPAMLAIPARLHTITTRMYGLFDYPPQEHLAAAYALPLLLATALLLYLQRRILGRRGFATITGKAGTQRLVRLGSWRYPALAAALAVVALACGSAVEGRQTTRTNSIDQLLRERQRIIYGRALEEDLRRPAERAEEEHRLLVSRIDKAVKSGALHSRNGARKKAAAARLRARL
jgi:ribosomal protein S20